jgi:hypothetical protein
MIKKVEISIIPHAEQRYPTVGDWKFEDDTLKINISDMQNDNYHELVAIHEYIEAMQCLKDGVSEEDVTKFDIEFEKWRAEEIVDELAEPGDDINAPYYYQHQIATKIEQRLAATLGVDWNEYDMAIRNL